MKRRKFLLGVGSTAAAGSALIGSGAFSRVESQRSVTIQVAEDPNAYLGMDKCRIDGSETPNSSYAHLDDDGHLEIFMNPENPTINDSPLGEGVNSDSTSWFDNVFQLCNQGKEDACVWIEDNENWPRVGDDANGVDGVDPEDRRVDFYLEDNRGQSIVGEENAIGIALGECRCIGIKTRSYGLSEGDEPLAELDNEVRIIADVGADCTGVPPEDITDEGVLSLAYEDLPKDDPKIDWDYNDWIVDIFGTYSACGEGGFGGGVSQFQWDIVPQARGARAEHKFEFDFDCEGAYTVNYYDENGNLLRTKGSAFTGGSGSVDITVWEDTSNTFDDLSNQDGNCEKPKEWAELTVTFDECCDIGTFDGSYGDHGSGLPFNPILENSRDGVTVGKNDKRLLVVPERWEWPTAEEHIADAYAGVSRDANDEPVFGQNWENSNVTGSVTSCNFEVNDLDNSIESS